MFIRLCAIVASFFVAFGFYKNFSVNNDSEETTVPIEFTHEVDVSLPAKLTVYGEMVDNFEVTVFSCGESILPFVAVFTELGGTVVWTNDTHAELSYMGKTYFLELNGHNSSLKDCNNCEYLTEPPGTEHPYFEEGKKELYVESNRVRVALKRMGTRLTISSDYDNAIVSITNMH